MRICYLAETRQIHTQRWVKYFVDKGYEVHLISFETASKNLENVNLHLLEIFGRSYSTKILKYTIKPVSALIQLKRLIKEIKPDIVHGHSVGSHTILGALTGFHPYVVSPWGTDVLIDPKNSIIMNYLVKITFKKADLIICDGCNIRKALIELGTEPKKIYRICWGADTQKFNPEQRSERIREDLGIFDSPMIISSKNLRPVYDIESLVKSIPLVLKEVPKAKFVIAGRGSQETKLKQLVELLGISDNVKFIGLIPSKEFPKYLASADIYVCTSLSDGGLAISTKEAMSCELPVVITDLKVNTEWIENGKNGCVVPLKDPKTLAEKIIYLIEHEDVREKFGENGRKLVKERFEYDNELRKVEKLYEQLIRDH